MISMEKLTFCYCEVKVSGYNEILPKRFEFAEQKKLQRMPEESLEADQNLNEQAWYLAYTKPRLENMAKDNLSQQGFEVFLPLFKKFKKTETGLVSVFEPMFPRYLFFRPSHEGQSIATVRSTKGVSHLVRFGFEPAVLQDSMVQAIVSLEQTRNQISVQEASPYKVDQAVKLKHNAFHNVQGLVHSVGSKRIAVLLEILGRPTVVQVEYHHLEVI
jgi:transcriptional antiterminator RfaH